MSSGGNTLEVPQEKVKKVSPRSPRRKAPARPKKKDDDGTPVKKTKSKASKENDKADEKSSSTSSISPAKKQYASLLDEMVGRGDMVLLDPITEEKIIENLKIRYGAKEIYTYIGPVLVSVNPYQTMDIYTHENIEQYRSKISYELPPHIYSLADGAYRSMKDHHLDQCIIISGESGSGKTEASKLVMQFVAAVSGKEEEVELVKQQLLQSNPVLEAFGNAKTNRNDNSSRFGKYMDIEFDHKGDPVGGIITNYLLEKSRVVAQSEGEQNFHIFYQLLAGASTDILEMLHLKRNVNGYYYLRGDAAPSMKENAEQFDITMEALNIIGFLPDEVSCILELLAAVLNLGNGTFSNIQDPEEEGFESCTLDKKECVGFACDMLGCSMKLLEECLTKRSVETRTDFVQKPLTIKEAEYARDALSKAIYDRLFSWLVRRINDRIKAKTKAKREVMGVLDIYGFEVFENNSFEQFIINYCNEKLQQLFIELTLTSEQDEYVREGIEWEHIDYLNNAVICELIEHPTKGMLAYLDEECLRPGKTTNETLLNKFNSHCLEHPHYESRASKHLLSDHTLPRDHFRLIHYAGKVMYNIQLFMDKNKDLLFADLSKAMFACERSLLKELFPEGELELHTKKRPQTTGHQFRTSVSQLMKNLMAKTPNYIRCIKPNDKKQPGIIADALLRHQVAYLGLLENVRVRRAGFAYRQDYDKALARYKMLCPKTWPAWKGRPKDGIKEILKLCCRSKKDYSYGRSKIFIRHPETVFDLEGRRKAKMVDLVILLQKVYRGWHQWRKFQDMRNAQIVIAANFKCYKWRQWFLEIRDAVITIQSFYRGMLARREFRILKYIRDATRAADIIRKHFLGWKARKEYKVLLFHSRYEGPALSIQCYFRGWKVRHNLRRVRAAIVIQKYYRGWHVRQYWEQEEAAIVIQKYFRGWKVRKYSVKDRAAIIIQKHFRGWQAREDYRFLRAVVTIQKFFRGWQAREEVLVLRKQRAAPLISRFMWQALCYRFIVSLFHNLPSNSLLDKRWPRSSSLFHEASENLRLIHHRWRCKAVRDYFIKNPQERRKMSEKSRASTLFKGKKSLYPKTVPIPFKSDHLNLKMDERWSKVVAQTNEQRIIWGDNVQKLNRKDAKGVPMVMVVTGNSFMLLDPKNLSMKYRVELSHVKHVSMSSYSDQIFVIHIDSISGSDRSYSKGDFVLRNPNVIEMVTKMHAVIHEVFKRKLQIIFTNEIQASFKPGDAPCSIRFQHNPRAGGAVSSPLCQRKGNAINIVV